MLLRVETSFHHSLPEPVGVVVVMAVQVVRKLVVEQFVEVVHRTLLVAGRSSSSLVACPVTFVLELEFALADVQPELLLCIAGSTRH
jgi:hypothetical protein